MERRESRYKTCVSLSELYLLMCGGPLQKSKRTTALVTADADAGGDVEPMSVVVDAVAGAEPVILRPTTRPSRPNPPHHNSRTKRPRIMIPATITLMPPRASRPKPTSGEAHPPRTGASPRLLLPTTAQRMPRAAGVADAAAAVGGAANRASGDAGEAVVVEATKATGRREATLEPPRRT